MKNPTIQMDIPVYGIDTEVAVLMAQRLAESVCCLSEHIFNHQSELNDLKTAVGEAVRNVFNWAYPNASEEDVCHLEVILDDADETVTKVTVSITDMGKGIADLETMKQPFNTESDDDSEHSGMGFTVMEQFADTCTATSAKAAGTEVILTKQFEF